MNLLKSDKFSVETERFLIRKFTPDDADDLFCVLSDNEVMKYIEPAFSFEQTKNFITDAGLCPLPLVWALEEKSTGGVRGHVIFHIYDDTSYEIGWILGRNIWNMGVASEITKALIKLSKEQGISSLTLECDKNQAVTRHIAEKFGFTLIESDDLCVYKLTL
ncbi:MAG: GNAT family N-acetyltransferase [Acutalibacteraceae bacterium]